MKYFQLDVSVVWSPMKTSLDVLTLQLLTYIILHITANYITVQYNFFLRDSLADTKLFSGESRLLFVNYLNLWFTLLSGTDNFFIYIWNFQSILVFINLINNGTSLSDVFQRKVTTSLKVPKTSNREYTT